MRRLQASLGRCKRCLSEFETKVQRTKKNQTTRDKANGAKQNTMYGSAANILVP